jgi:hypothetical protein
MAGAGVKTVPVGPAFHLRHGPIQWLMAVGNAASLLSKE